MIDLKAVRAEIQPEGAHLVETERTVEIFTFLIGDDLLTIVKRPGSEYAEAVSTGICNIDKLGFTYVSANEVQIHEK